MDRVTEQKNCNSQAAQNFVCTSTNPIKNKQSGYRNQYEHFIRKYKNPKNFRLEDFQKQLSQHKITLNKQQVGNKKLISVLNSTKQFGVVEILVAFGPFCFEIKVLNLSTCSSTIKELDKLNAGSFGSLYWFSDPQNERYAIKSIKYLQKNKHDLNGIGQRICRVIVQYCFNKLFSVLKIGPHVRDLLSFDLIIYQDFIEFAMQLCENMKNQYIDQLRSSLVMMHELNIIHGDIKPQNIMWSPKYNKNVFIDFGFTRMLQEKPGLCTFTPYFGSYKYSSPQMKCIFLGSGFGFVDLYFNDVYAFQQIQLTNTKKDVLEVIKPQQIEKDRFLMRIKNFKLIKLLFERKTADVYDFLKNNSITLFSQTISFFKQAPSPTLNSLSALVSSNLSRLIWKSCSQASEQPPKFQLRFKQVSRISNLKYLNAGIQFIMLVSDQDLTLRRLQEKKKCLQVLRSTEQASKYFWSHFLNFCYNPYTSRQQVFKQFQHVKQSLQIIWQLPSNAELQLFFKAFQISTVVREKYKIDLFELRKQLGLCMLGDVMRTKNQQLHTQMELSEAQKEILKRNWKLFSKVSLRFISSQYEIQESITSFLRDSSQIQSPRPLFLWLINYATFLHSQSKNLKMLNFLQMLKGTAIVQKSRLFCQVYNQVYRIKLLQFSLDGILKHSLKFFGEISNCYFEYYLCRHSYFIQLMMQPLLNKQYPQAIIKGIDRMFMMKKQTEGLDYFYSDLFLFCKELSRTKNDSHNHIKAHIFSLFKDYLINHRESAVTNLTDCQDILLMLNQCYKLQFMDNLFIRQVISLLRQKIQKSHLEIMKLRYYATEVDFFLSRSQCNRSAQISKILVSILDKYTSGRCEKTKNYEFSLLCSAIYYNNDYNGKFWIQNSQKIYDTIRGYTINIYKYCFIHYQVLSKYFIYWQKYQECFYHFIDLFKEFQIANYNGVDIEFYITNRRYLKSIFLAAPKQIATKSLAIFYQLASNTSYQQLRKIPSCMILVQVILDALYTDKSTSKYENYILNQLNLLFRWAYVWLPSCFQILKSRFLSKISFYVHKFISLQQNNSKKQKLLCMKKLRNPNYYFSLNSFNKLLNALKGAKTSKSEKTLDYLAKIDRRLSWFNQNKKMKVIPAGVTMSARHYSEFEVLINSNYIELEKENRYLGNLCIEKKSQNRNLLNNELIQAENQLFDILFCSERSSKIY